MANNNGLAEVKVINLNREELLTVFGYVISKTKNLVRERDSYLKPKKKLEGEHLRLKSKVRKIKSCFKENAQTQIKGLGKYTGPSFEKFSAPEQGELIRSYELYRFYSDYSEKYNEEIDFDYFDCLSHARHGEDILYSFKEVIWLWDHTYDEVNSVINNLNKVPVSKWRDYVDDNLSTILRNSICIFQNKMQSMPTGLEEEIAGWKEFLDNYDTKKAKLDAEAQKIKAEIDQLNQERQSVRSIGTIKRFFTSSEKLLSKLSDLGVKIEVDQVRLRDIASKEHDLNNTNGFITSYWENDRPTCESFIRLNKSSEFCNNLLQEFVQEFNTVLNNLDILLQDAPNKILACYEQQKIVEEKINKLAKPIQLLEADYPGLKSPAQLKEFIPFSQGVDDKYDVALRIVPEGFRNLVDLNVMFLLLTDYRADNYKEAANLAREEQFHDKVLSDMSYMKIQNSATISAVKSVARAVEWNGETTRRVLRGIQGTLNYINDNNRANAASIVGSIDNAENKLSDNISRSSQVISDSITENAHHISENAAKNTQVIVDSIEESTSNINDSLTQMEVTTSIGLDILADKIVHGQDTRDYNSIV